VANESQRPALEMGGQAVIEGVLMRTRHGYSVALRRLSGEILVRSVPYRSLAAKWPWLKRPFVRGALGLFEMLAIGYQALRFSAEVAEADALEQERREKAEKNPAAAAAGSGADGGANVPVQDTAARGALPRDAASAWRDWAMTATLLLSLAVAVGMMVVAPNLLAAGLSAALLWLGWIATPIREEQAPVVYNLIAGGFRAVILFGYIWAISRLQEIRRVFEFHGAEHKAVFAYENGDPLTVERAQRYTTLHPRCGTSFLVVVLVVSVIVFAAIAWVYPAVWPGFVEAPFVVKKLFIFAGHILALPLLASVSYEFLKFSAHCRERHGALAWLAWPGLQTQRLTTRPPDDAQVEVALAALRAALEISEDMTEERIETFPAAGESEAPAAPSLAQPAAATVAG